MPQDYNMDGLEQFRGRNTGAGPLSSLQLKSFACSGSQNLYPTHPSQMLKLYHDYQTARYDHRQIDAQHDGCALSRLGSDDPRAGQPRADVVARLIAESEATGRPIRCQLGHILHQVFVSDTYIDACGNYYRGVKWVEFLELDENMGTLWSRGRHTFNTPDGLQADNFTFAVPHTDFFVLAELLPGDMAGIERLRAAARETHTLDATGRLFLLK